MTRPRSISVVIPVKDDAAELDRCLRALAAQSRPALEVIVVDNGSSDTSRAVAAANGARVVTQSRAGIPAAAAEGYDVALGEILARLDADTIPPTTWLLDIGEAMLDADAVTGPGVLRGHSRTLTSAYDLAYLLVCGAALGHPRSSVPPWPCPPRHGRRCRARCAVAMRSCTMISTSACISA